ncbi:MAG: hypothetical protein NTX33_09140 [Propionibacteriales bacterium]|nr:hypothetical protein [Propionibacteriales bacterium]
MPDRVSHLSRRAFVVAGVGGTALTLTGCDALDSLLGEEEPAAPGAVSPTAPAADADSALVDEVATAIAEAGALATATGTTIPGLARIGLRLAKIHEAHAAELGRTTPADPPVVTGGKATALRRLWRRETALQDQLVSAAQAAESGALAQVFASMAAGLAQQQAVLT